MNFYGASNSIQVPTKTSTNGGNTTVGGSSSSDGNNNNSSMLHSRSNSSNSLDVAASIFSSMQDLEARGSNLSSILGRAGGGGVGNNAGITAAAMMGGGGGGMDPRLGAGMMGGGVSQYHPLAAMAGAQQQSVARHPDPQIAALMEMQSSLSRRNTPDPMSNLLGGGAGPSSASMAIQLRKLEMEEMLLKYQQNNRASLLDSLNGGGGGGGGYNPIRGAGVAAGGVLPQAQMKMGEGGGGATSRRGSNGSSILDEFTPEELLQEVTRRKSGLSSSIGDLYDTVLSRTNSREDLVGAMYNQMRGAGSTSGTGRLSVGGLSPNSLDDLTVLALAGKNGDKALMEKLLRDTGGESNTGNKAPEEKKKDKDEADEEDEISGEVNSAPRIITVPTANPDAKLESKKSDTSADSTVVTEDAEISDIDDDKKTANGDKKKRKRSDSTASFDALLSAFGDELTDLDKKKIKTKKTNGADNDDEDDKPAASSVNEQKHDEKNGDKDDMSTAKEEVTKEMARPRSANSVGSLHSTSLEGGRSSAVQAQIDALLKRDAAAAGRGNNSSSINDALEAMRREEIMIRERRMHEQVILQRQRENAIRDMVLRQRHGLPPMGHPPMGLPPMAHHPQMGMPLPQQHMLPGSIPESEMARLAGLFEGRVPGVAPDLMRHPHAVLTQAGMSDAAALDMIARFQGTPAGFPPVHYVTAKPNRPKTKPAKVHKPPPPKVEWKNNNKEVLAQFLKDYGDEAKESIKRTLDVIAKSEKSVADLHSWDKAQGLRKCHSRTVVKTRRSRNALKAFLKGEDVPKEPVKQKRKKQKKREIQQIRVNLPFLVHC